MSLVYEVLVGLANLGLGVFFGVKSFRVHGVCRFGVVVMVYGL